MNAPKIEVNNPFEQDWPSGLVEQIAKGTISFLAGEGIIKKGQRFELSMALVDASESLKLNRQFRKKNSPTDVLSFCYELKDEKITAELVLCPSVIEQNAKNDRIEKNEEMAKNIIHGILHVVGFEHSQEMFALQGKILKMNLAR